jgi:hypothetical protein
MCHAGPKVRKLTQRATDNKSGVAGEARKNSLKLTEQRGNLYENKGPLWKTGWQSGNVVENKGTYDFRAGML